MKIGIVSDIHGNFHALQAVLKDIQFNQCDMVVFLGDYIFAGVNNNEILDLLISYESIHENAIVLKGNIEDLIYPIESKEEWIYPINYDIYSNFTQEHINWIKGLKSDHIEVVENKVIKFIHNPCEDFLYEMVNPIKREQNKIKKSAFEKLSSETKEDVLIYGHYHLFLDEQVSETRFICPSSVGTPFNGSASAQYMIISVESNNIRTKCIEVDYDINSQILCLKDHIFYKKHRDNLNKYIRTIESGHNYL